MTKRKPFVGKYGSGGENGPDAAEDALLYMEGGMPNRSTWALALVAGVDYANFVETIKKHDVISELGQYMARYFKKM